MDLFVTISNATFGQVVGGHFDLNFVASEDFDVMHAHFAGDMGYDLVAILQFNAEHGITQRLDHCTIQLYGSLFCHLLIVFVNLFTCVLYKIEA